jgi:hypothetical protein
MIQFDTSTLLTTLNSFFSIVAAILRFDEAIIDSLFYLEEGNWIGIGIVILGGVSLSLGQSVVLFANRVRRRRFIF